MGEGKNNTNEKLPLGICPEYFYEKERILELTRAISEYVKGDHKTKSLNRWTEELYKRVQNFVTLNIVDDMKIE